MEVLIILAGGLLVFGGYRLSKHTPRFETVKSTSGRTVKFLNYPEAKKHKRSKTFGKLLVLVGVAILGTGILLEAFYKS